MELLADERVIHVLIKIHFITLLDYGMKSKKKKKNIFTS